LQVAIARPEEPASNVDICIVVDVLRATTTAAVLCHRLGELYAIRSPQDLPRLPQRSAGYAVFSELVGLESDLLRFDNSPAIAREVELGDRAPILVTTNGTIAVGLASQIAREVVLASFINLSSVVDFVRRSGAAKVAVMPAGNINKAQRCVEDDGCAQTIVARLSGAADDVSAVIAACHVDERIVRRRAREPGLAADLELCFALDGLAVVPRVAERADAGCFLIRRA
jgi:2-phosphosulfolactate phosphatase